MPSAIRKECMRSCVVCGGELTGRQRRYDSAECRKQQSRADWIHNTYGLTPAEWDTIWRHQEKRCAICKRAPRQGESFHVDHEHHRGPAGPVRGILCPYCKTRLVGRLKSAERAQALADYLLQPPATVALGRTVTAAGRPRRKRARRTSVAVAATVTGKGERDTRETPDQSNP
ncbi:endonuclease domain-containing protein [Micromonospora sp. WMMA1363]|uniref:endonuclease domain-containing protein n=1 Tax=Micromonospora sp. WMMA1363 TaxID=3053985 RepID=UPI00338FD165